MTSLLPDWPRWARILSAVVVVASIVALVLWLASCTSVSNMEPVKEEPTYYRIEVIDNNLLAVVISGKGVKYDNSSVFIIALREIKETYIILDTTAVIRHEGFGSTTSALLVQVEEK